jgi:hypothetical protein
MDGRHVAATAQQGHSGDAEYAADAETRSAAGVGNGLERLEKRAQLCFLEGQYAVGGRRCPGFAGLRQLGGTECFARAGLEFLEPEPLDVPVRDVEVERVAREAPALARHDPAARLVAGAAELFDVSEGLGQKRAVAEGRLPLGGQCTQRRSKRFRGQIRLGAAVVEQQVATVLDDELLPLGPLRRVPSDPFVAILERIARRPPGQQRHPFAVAHHHLPQEVPGWLG